MLFDFAARIVLLPVLIGQAFFVRWRMTQLPEPTGARSGTAGDGPVLRLLIVGDSSAAGVGVTMQDDALLGQVVRGLRDEFTVKFELIAKTGARTPQALDWLKGREDRHYDIVITALGVNDVTKGTTCKAFAAQQNALLDHIQAHLKPACVLVSGLPPVRAFPALPQPLRWVLGRQAQRFDDTLQALVCARADCERLDFDLTLDVETMAMDGFHPGPPVYAAWAHTAVQQIRSHAPFA